MSLSDAPAARSSGQGQPPVQERLVTVFMGPDEARELRTELKPSAPDASDSPKSDSSEQAQEQERTPDRWGTVFMGGTGVRKLNTCAGCAQKPQTKPNPFWIKPAAA